jgi:hypothetical protein
VRLLSATAELDYNFPELVSSRGKARGIQALEIPRDRRGQAFPHAGEPLKHLDAFRPEKHGEILGECQNRHRGLSESPNPIEVITMPGEFGRVSA